MFTIRPAARASIWGKTRWCMLSGPRRLMSMSACHSPGFVSTKFWKRSQPALLTSTSTVSPSSAAFASSYLEISNTRAFPRVSRATRSAASRFRSATRTFMLREKRRQIAAPIAPPPPVTSTVFTRPSFRSLVDDALRLADRAFHGTDSDLRADADRGLDAALEARLSGGVAFDDHGQVVERSLLGYLQHVVRRKPGLLEDQLLDLRGEDVDATDDQHVVGAAGDLLDAPHGARAARKEAREVARAVADHRQRFLRQRGDDQLA